MSNADLEPDDGGRAFPRYPYDGMTTRDYMAAAALPAIITWASRKGTLKNMLPIIGMAAYDVADEMLKARKTDKTP